MVFYSNAVFVQFWCVHPHVLLPLHDQGGMRGIPGMGLQRHLQHHSANAVHKFSSATIREEGAGGEGEDEERVEWTLLNWLTLDCTCLTSLRRLVNGVKFLIG